MLFIVFFTFNHTNFRSVSDIIQRGGTILRTARCPEFETIEGQEKAVKTLKKYDIDALVVIGGNPIMSSGTSGTTTFSAPPHSAVYIAMSPHFRHIQRGGSPTMMDRQLAAKFAIRAVDLLLEGKSQRAVGIHNNEIIDYDASIHTVVSAIIEEISYIVFFEYLKQSLVISIVNTGILKLISYRTHCRTWSVLQKQKFLFRLF